MISKFILALILVVGASAHADIQPNIPLFSSTLDGLVPASGGGTTNFLRADGTWVAGAAGAPGGSDTQVQYNGSGSFAGDSNFVWDNTNKSLLLGGSVQPSGVTGTPLSLLSTNATSANGFEYLEYVQSSTSGSGIAIRKSRGTTGSRTNVLSGDGLGNITFNGNSSGGYGGGTTSISSTAEEDFTGGASGNRGSSLSFSTTPTGVATPNGVRRSSMKLSSGSGLTSFRLFQQDGTNGITMTVPTSNYTMSFPPSLPAGNGFWTISSGGSGNFTQLSGDATTGAAQGSVVVTRLNGNAVASTTPTDNQVMMWNTGPNAWHPATLSGDVSTTAIAGNLAVTKIQGVAVSATGPTNTQVLAYNSGTVQWEPTTSSSGSPGGPTTAIQFNNSGSFGGTAQGTGGNGINFTYDGAATVKFNSGAPQGVGFPVFEVGDSGAGATNIRLMGRQNLNAAAGYAPALVWTHGTNNDLGAVATADSGSSSTADIAFMTGAAGGGDSGNLLFQPGTASGTVGKIKLDDRSGTITAGQVWTATASSGAGHWSGGYTKVTKTFSNFSTAATTNSITLFSLPAATLIKDIIIRPTTAFTGGSISAYTISVGISGSNAKYASAFDVFSAITGTRFQVSNSTDMENFGSATNITATATSTGDTLNNASGGSVDIYYSLKGLP